MFQRLQKNLNLDFLDNKLAEDEERQKQAGKRSPSATRSRRSDGTTNSGSRRAGNRLQIADARQNDGSPPKEADPEDFDIGDDAGEPSRGAMSPPAGKKDETADAEDSRKGRKSEETRKEKSTDKAGGDELPLEVRQKLAKLVTLTARYQDLLRNYRTAHAHVAAIEPFEATLREHTPLTSVLDPGAFVEFLNNRALQSDMVMEEFKRVSAEHKEAVKERDELKVKLQEAEQQAKDAFDEAAGLRDERDTLKRKASETNAATDADSDPLGASRVNDKSGGKLKSAKKASTENDDEEDFFSHDVEVSRAKDVEDTDRAAKIGELEAEITSQKDYINELSTENASLQNDLEMTRLDLSAMVNKVGVKEENIKGIQSELAAANAKLQEALGAQDNAREPTENVKRAKSTPRDEKRIETLQNLVGTLRKQADAAERSQKEAEGRMKDLRFEITRLEGEAKTSQTIVSSLRGHESAAESLRKRLLEAEHERDDAQRLADSKKGHEHAVASIKSQLKRVEKERDSAYQMIIDCGKCSIPEKERDVEDTQTESGRSNTDRSVTPETRSQADADSTENTQPNSEQADGNELTPHGDGKKKSKKKKSKSKKKTSSEDPAATTEDIPSLEDLQRNPEKITEVMAQIKDRDNPMVPLLLNFVESIKERNDSRDEDHDRTLRHHEAVNEEQSQKIRDHEVVIRAKTEEIFDLQESLRKATAEATTASERDAQIDRLRQEISELQQQLSERDAKIEELLERLKGQAEWEAKLQSMNDELEMVRDDLIEKGKLAVDSVHELKTSQDQNKKLEEELSTLRDQHIASDNVNGVLEQLENVKKEKASLQVAKDACDKQIEELKAQSSTSGADLDTKRKALNSDLDRLRSKATELEKELAAANQLAQTRFKDLSTVKELYNKVQVDFKKSREELAELKTVRNDLEKTNASVRRLEAKDKDLRSEIAVYKSRVKDKDTEIGSLNDKIKKSNERSTVLEESYETARKDLERSESTRDEAVEARDKLQSDLQKTEEDLRRTKPRLEELQRQVKKFTEEAASLRDELELKTAQQASAQSQMHTQENETQELSMQMREIRLRNQSLQEDLAEAERMLSERSRDAETMRRMLSDAQGQAETRVKEMRDKMDMAVEERDRADDELSSVGRRRAREVEDLKTKLRDAERDAHRAKEARDDAEKKERDSLAQREELERRAAQAQAELAEVRSSMHNLQDSLDEGDRYTQELEKQRAEMKRAVEEKETRLEKLQKSGKTMAEELRNLQNAAKLRQASVQSSSRSSVESARTVSSPSPKGRSNGQTTAGSEGTDSAYLKQVLLQFLEQKEKKNQMQLVPVLGRLLHFNSQEEQKWMSAIAAK